MTLRAPFERTAWSSTRGIAVISPSMVVTSAVLGPTSLVTVDADGLLLQAMGPMPAPAPGSPVRMSWRRAHLFTLNGDAIDHFDSVGART